MSDLIIIIPAYNEEKNIEGVIAALRENAPEYDIVVVDDGSKDGTGEKSRGLGVKVLRHRVNLGLTETVRTGMKYALLKGYSYCLQFDGDGQHDATAVRGMLEVARESGSDITIGSRYLEGGSSPAMKALGRKLISFCIKATTGAKITDPTSGMRMYDRKAMELMASSGQFSPEPDTLAYLIRKGLKAKEIPVTMTERKSGKSYLDITESIRYMFRMCTSILIIQWLR